MLNCRRATSLISDELDRPLFWSERLRLGMHLFLCGPCTRFRRAVQWLHDVLAKVPNELQLTPEALGRIRQALERASQDG
jgi:hypothetical protein